MTDLKVKTGVGSTKTKKVVWEGGENDPYIDVMALSDEAGNVVSVQYPLPTDSDSVYAKDVNVAGSDVGTFIGNIVDLFNDYGPTIKLTDVSASNPKSFTVVFNRPVESDTFGIGSSTKSISNVKIFLKDQFGEDRSVIDDSSNNTKYSSKVYSFEPESFISAKIEFHTADQVDLSGMRVPKDGHVTARLEAQKPDGTSVNVNATAGGSLKTSMEEFDEALNTNPLPVVLTDPAGTARKSEMDNYFKVPITIDIAHHEVHEGDHYEFSEQLQLGNGVVQDYILTTPNSGKLGHFGWEVEAVDGPITVIIYEGTDRVGTTLQNISNSNCAIATSGDITVHKNHTGGTTDGTALYPTAGTPRRLGARNVSASAGSGNEHVLASNTKYLVRIANQHTGDNYIFIRLVWYEHTSA